MKHIITSQPVTGTGQKLICTNSTGKELGHIYLYFLHNDLHQEPFGLLEDLFVNEASRGQGIGTALIKEAISLAKSQKCYKLIGTSRKSRIGLHGFYESSGFLNYGCEFRMDLSK